MWGEISKNIKEQYVQHLGDEIKLGIATHPNQVLGEIILAVGKVENELFAATSATQTADSILSAVEARRWDATVVSHKNLNKELVTQNRHLAAMKKQQRGKFARIDQLNAARQ